jgi:hypothetical protein
VRRSCAGNSSRSLEQKDFTGRVGLNGLTPKFGGSYRVDLSSTRLSSNNFFNGLDPAMSARLSFGYTQPLVRGLRTDDSRRQIEIAKKNLTLTDVQFRQHFAVLARGVMLKGVGREVLYPKLLALLAFTIILVGVSAHLFRSCTQPMEGVDRFLASEVRSRTHVE